MSELARALLEELGALKRVVCDLQEEVQHANRRALAAEDRAEIRRLLPSVYALKGGQMWCAAELFEQALSSDGAGDLLAQLSEWNTEAGGLRSFGRMLDRCSGTVHNGLRLVTCGSERAGKLYAVTRVSGGSKPADPLA